MRKTEIKKILLMAAIVVCGVCLFAKSFLVLHTYPEYKGDGVVLMFKLDPLEPDHVREDTFEADLVSPLRICRDEMKFVGQDTLEGIFALPLAVWLFLFLLPLAVWLKMRHPSLKKRWLAAGVVGLPLLVWVMWMFRTYNPTEKVYSADGQYSYYTAKYNYNKIPILNWSTDNTSKAWLYDEVEHMRLASGSAGNVEWNDKFGFQDWTNTTFFFKSRQYELPRPIDEMAIRMKEQKAREEMERAEAIRKFHEQQAESPIPEADVAYLEPIIRRWLDFYDIDLAGARLVAEGKSRCINCPPNPAVGNPHDLTFTPEMDSPSLVQMSYSPDRQRYVDMFISVEMRDSVWYDTGAYDVDQQVNLVDRRRRANNNIQFYGSSARIQDAFWKDNDVFVTVGFSDYSAVMFRIDVYDIPGKTHKIYDVVYDGMPEHLGDLYTDYLHDVYLSSRGIVPYGYKCSE